MEAIVLAGGLGRRLRQVVSDTPKPMADIRGRPFLSYLLDHLSSNGVKRAVLSVGYMHETIIKYFGFQYNRLALSYEIEDAPLGTGGAIRRAMHACHGDDMLVMNGDTFFAVDLRGMADLHVASGAAMTVALKPVSDAGRYGSVVLDDDRVVGFEEKSQGRSGLINGGVYVMNRSLQKELDACGTSFSIEYDFLQRQVGSLDIRGYVSDGYFIDIGIPADYERAKAELPLFS